MRPHLLTITAFGSFPGTETVSFDALTEAGLFLVHGPTGAGKTTVLDALCFALFGKVANAQRDSARSLRCDHAAPGTGPAVTLEVTVRGRLLRIERSPAWQRPKLRGSGFTEEKAKVIVQERVTDAWQGLTTRADEAGDLVGGLLGMNADQFCQVAMLPQGDFARFLRADGDDRRKLLERLFTVKVYTQAETWLAERRKLAWREQQELRQQVDFAIQRIEEAAGDDLSELPGQEPADRENDPLAWAGGLLESARAVVTGSAAQHAAAESALREARNSWEAATALAERQRRHAEAATLRRTLDERAEERADLQALLDDAARADRVLPLVTAARQRAEAAAKTRTLATDAVARARPLLEGAAAGTDDPGFPVTLAALERERHDESARLSELLTEEARLSVIRRDLARVEDELTGLATDDEHTTARLAELPALIEQAEGLLAQSRVDAAKIPAAEAVRVAVSDILETDRELVRLAAQLETLTRRQADLRQAAADLPAQLATAKDALARVRAEAATVPAAIAARDAAGGVLEAARRRDALTAELQASAGELKQLVDQAQHLRERWLDLRQARLDGMAAELARDLADNRPCVVCGSLHHPDPAAPAPAAPSAEDERAAESAHEAALARREAAERAVAGLESRLSAAMDAATPSYPHPWSPPGAEDLGGGGRLVDPGPSEGGGRLVDPRPSEGGGRLVDPGPSEGGGRLVDPRPSEGGPRADGAGRGLGAEDAARAVREAEHEVARLREVAGREPALAAEVERIEARQQRAVEQEREIGEALAAQRTHHTQLTAERTRLLSRLPATFPAAGRTPDSPGTPAPVPGRVLAPGEAAAPGHVSATAGVQAPGGTAPVAGGSHAPGHTDAKDEGADPAPGHGSDAADSFPAEVGPEVLRAAVGEVDRLRRSAGREAGLAGQVERLQRERAELEERLRRVTAKVAACRTRQEELSGDAGRLAARLDSARGGDPTLAARLSRLGDEAELLREAIEATTRAVAAAREREDAREAAERAAEEAEFADVADALAAARPDEERMEKDALLRELDAQYAAVTSTLADPVLVAAAGRDAPDLPGLDAARERAEEDYAALVSSRDRAAGRARRLEALHGELAACLTRWEPAAQAHRLTERMASLASGTSGDNQWSMSLSSFVLGERLRQVVAAANDRLDHMSGGRYQLQHDLRKTAGARGRSGGGLGLRIADGWTGVDRDPATLSGGESFITSLALALGLADVVTAEAGGAEIGTLFVDEGFGTLDEDTLDGVLDILDGLRDGGRAVGIVSHVAELRTRIPAQLKVTKSRTGSTLSVTGV
ncbi:AAA family ATPase [Nonomuraea typhae]|uniref:Nuclease SbcCD subunit C n=1 Tax=Nonomuraea typhae TaxID=2603600 RepID=A0ABW7YJZ5_9ACTN